MEEQSKQSVYTTIPDKDSNRELQKLKEKKRKD